MKIWHLTRTLHGGAGQYALRLSNALRAEGAESTVLVAEGPVSDGAVVLKRVDSPIRRFAARAFRSISHRICTTSYHSIRGLELYDPPKPILAGDIVHLQGLCNWVGLPGLKRLIPKGAKVFQTAHGPWEFSGGCVILAGTKCDRFKLDCSPCPALRAGWSRLANWELRTKRRFIERYAVQPVANSSWTAARIRESWLFRGADYLPIIPPIVHEAFISHRSTNLRTKLQIKDDKPVLCLGARALTDAFKGIPEFLVHFHASGDIAKQTTVLVFGDGVISCPQGLDGRFFGAVRNERDLADIFLASDVFVSPSSLESFGMTLVEAQATGTPVVGFDVGGVRDAMWPNDYANLVPAGRWDLLIQRVLEMLSQGNQRERARSMTEWVASSFSASVVVKMQLEVYRN